MSWAGNRNDNAPIEGFFRTLKVKRAHHCCSETHADVRQVLFVYIEGLRLCVDPASSVKVKARMMRVSRDDFLRRNHEWSRVSRCL